MRHRRAVSLAEVLVVLSLSSAILPVGIGLIHRVMNEQTRARNDQDMHRVAERLTRQFRQDIHRTTQVANQDDTAGRTDALQLQLPDQDTVAYAVLENVVTRTHTCNGDAAIHREEYSFSSDCEIKFQENSAPHRVLLTVRENAVIANPAPSAGPAEQSVEPRVLVHIDAVVGRDHRFDTNALSIEAP